MQHTRDMLSLRYPHCTHVEVMQDCYALLSEPYCALPSESQMSKMWVKSKISAMHTAFYDTEGRLQYLPLTLLLMPLFKWRETRTLQLNN